MQQNFRRSFSQFLQQPFQRFLSESALSPSLKPAKYTLRCLSCGAAYEPDPFRLHCDLNHEPALLRAEHHAKQLEIKSVLPGVFRFIDWLPVEYPLEIIGRPITYQSKHLAAYLGLEQLFISFNGYWPEREAYLLTCSFKELEAPSVLARIPKDNPQTLVIASAGNTGRAFADVCSRLQIPLCLVIPEKNLSAIWSTHSFHPHVCLVVVSGGGDYADAIALGHLISQMEGFFPEGGAANVARRDGMGLTVLDAAATLGRIPDHYFQAVGSGTGGISAWEANLRLLEDGRFGTQRMKLHLAQNAPFNPMVDAWKAQSRSLPQTEETAAKSQINQVDAKVLTNRKPAYSLTGGLYEALTATQGEMYAVTNQELGQARLLFRELEAIDIGAAAGVATAALIRAVELGKVPKQDCIMLNITNGGFERIQQDHTLQYLKPDVVFSPQEITPEIVTERMSHRLNFLTRT
ncbi:cysteate synthase [Phormidium tenue FACHB-886]|nr:cysteate synthase [Phormidium tenue FACHB-886]